jgi:hypothetical protein
MENLKNAVFTILPETSFIESEIWEGALGEQKFTIKVNEETFILNDLKKIEQNAKTVGYELLLISYNSFQKHTRLTFIKTSNNEN